MNTKLKTINNFINESDVYDEETRELLFADNTEYTLRQFIKIAKMYGIPYRCLVFNVSRELAKHNNAYRGLGGGRMVGNIVYNVYYKKFEQVGEEGFYRVDLIEFVWEGVLDGFKKYLY